MLECLTECGQFLSWSDLWDLDSPWGLAKWVLVYPLWLWWFYLEHSTSAKGRSYENRNGKRKKCKGWTVETSYLRDVC
jgi:hypothetical protein